MIQNVSAQYSNGNGLNSLGLRAPQGEFSILPLFHREHAHQLLGKDTEVGYDRFENSELLSVNLALYVGKRTNELLPEQWQSESQRVTQAFIEAANLYQMDPLFLMAMARHESHFNPEIVGRFGEIGLMQVKPSTAQWILSEKMGEDLNDEEVLSALRDPAKNIMIGAAYLAHLRENLKRHGTAYISAYNMGAVNVRNHLREGVRPQIYMNKVMAEYSDLTLSFVASGNLAQLQVAVLDSTYVLQ